MHVYGTLEVKEVSACRARSERVVFLIAAAQSKHQSGHLVSVMSTGGRI